MLNCDNYKKSYYALCILKVYIVNDNIYTNATKGRKFIKFDNLRRHFYCPLQTTAVGLYCNSEYSWASLEETSIEYGSHILNIEKFKLTTDLFLRSFHCFFLLQIFCEF